MSYHDNVTVAVDSKPVTEPVPTVPGTESSRAVPITSDVERTTNESIPSSPSSNADEIEYIYLNWDTEVANKPVFPNGLPKDYPAFPDLSKFDNPYGWSRTRKNVMTCVSCVTNGVAAYASGSYAAADDQLTQLWHISPVVFNLGITIFVVAFGIGPMFLAPFSEINGRRPVFIASGLLFVICQLCCAVTQSFGGMLAARFFTGIGGSTFSTMVGGILADIYVSSERNTAMVLFAGATFFGTGLGPLVSGFLAQNLLWRWVFYIQIMISGFFVLLVTIFFKETRGPIILARRARAINRWYEAVEGCGAIGMDVPLDSSEKSLRARRIRYKVLAEEQRATIWKMISLSLYRPAHMLLTEPVVVVFALWISFSWAVLYLQFSSIPLVFRTNHNFNLQESGAVFAAVCIGGILSSWLSIYQDQWAVRKFGTKFTSTPEGRLWFTCAEALLMPIGMFWFGWTCFSSIHWIVPSIALGAITMGIFSIFLATMNYMADVYQIYASSAMAALGVCRNLLAGVFPLVAVQMFDGMGFQAASSLLGGIGFLLSLGPIALIFFGPRIRAKSKIAKQFVEGGG